MELYILLFLLNIIYSVITKELIAEQNDKVFIDCPNLELSIINPYFGHILSGTILWKLRNFYFNINPHFYLCANRVHVKDKSTDMLSDLLINLFPSPGGNLVAVTNGKSNIANAYFKNNSNRLYSVKLFANLFLNIVNKDQKIKLYNIDETVDNKREFKKLLQKLRICEKSIYNNTEDKEVVMLSLLTIHSFMLEVLETQDEYLEFLTILINNINDNVLNNLSQFSISNIAFINNDEMTLIEFFRSLYLIKSSKFPYDKNNPPACNTVVSIYNRNTDTFNYMKKISDCMEIALLHLFNFLFYNEETEKYDLNHLKLDDDSSLRIFYEKYNEPFNITDKVRKDWFKVVQCLEDFECHSNKAFGKIKYIIAEEKNELSPSITNAINVIVKLCFFNTTNNYINKFYELVNDKIENDKIKLVFIKTLELLSRKSQHIFCSFRNLVPRYQIFYGSVSIHIESRCFTNLVNTKMIFRFDESHASVFFVSRTLKNEKAPECISILPNSQLSPLEYTFITYIKNYYNINFKEYDKTFIDLIYNTNPLITNEQKVKHLYFIFNNKTNNTNIAEMIIKSAALTDVETRKMFLPFYLKFDDLKKELDCRSKIDTWLYTLRINNLRNENCKVLQSWNDEISNLNFGEEECNLQELNFNGIIYALSVLINTNLKNLKINLLSLKDEMAYIEIFKFIEKLEHLKYLEINNDRINKDIMERICCLISNRNNQIVSLNTKDSPLDFECFELLSETLKNENCNLNTLNFTRSDLNNQKIKTLSDFLNGKQNKITSLNISSNFLKIEDLDVIFGSLKHENNHLTSLNISNTFKNLDGCGKIIANALEDPNCKLNELDISYNLILTCELNLIITALLHENCRLKVLKIRYTNMQKKLFFDISKILKNENCKIKKIDISANNYLRKEDVEFLRDELKDMKKDITIIFEENLDLTK